MVDEHALGGEPLCGHSAAIWAKVTPQDLHCSSGRCSMDSQAGGGPFVIHYLNNYQVIGAPMSPECADALFGVFDRLENHASKRILDQVISDRTVCDILHIRMRDTQWHIL